MCQNICDSLGGLQFCNHLDKLCTIFNVKRELVRQGRKFSCWTRTVQFKFFFILSIRFVYKNRSLLFELFTVTQVVQDLIATCGISRTHFVVCAWPMVYLTLGKTTNKTLIDYSYSALETRRQNITYMCIHVL